MVAMQMSDGSTLTVSEEQISPGKHAVKLVFSSPEQNGSPGTSARVLISPNEITHKSGPRGEHIMVVPVAQVQPRCPM